MLVLTRRIGERLMIGKDTTLVVLDVQGAQVRFGIEAPLDVQVHREEVFERIRRDDVKSPKS